MLKATVKLFIVVKSLSEKRGKSIKNHFALNASAEVQSCKA